MNIFQYYLRLIEIEFVYLIKVMLVIKSILKEVLIKKITAWLFLSRFLFILRFDFNWIPESLLRRLSSFFPKIPKLPLWQTHELTLRITESSDCWLPKDIWSFENLCLQVYKRRQKCRLQWQITCMKRQIVKARSWNLAVSFMQEKVWVAFHFLG